MAPAQPATDRAAGRRWRFLTTRVWKVPGECCRYHQRDLWRLAWICSKQRTGKDPGANETAKQFTMTQEQYADAYSGAFDRTVRFLVSRGVSSDSAEEAAQAAWARGWERRTQLRDPKRLVTWVNAIALNLFRNGCRRRETSELPSDIPVPPQTSPRAIDLRRVIEKCTPAEQEMLQKHYLGGYTSKELAAQADCTATAIRVRLLRLRRRLQTVMGDKRVRSQIANTVAPSAFGQMQPPAAPSS
jgi:RNA polymerase sigma factor (sigma-70 family)